MTITLLPEHERLLLEALDTGAYQSPDDVIGRALAMLRSEDEWSREQSEVIADKIERAFAQFDRGEFYSAETSRTDLAKRKAVWLSEQQRG